MSPRLHPKQFIRLLAPCALLAALLPVAPLGASPQSTRPPSEEAHTPETAPRPATITPVPRSDWAKERQTEVLNRVREAKQPIPVVFIGDSITQGWEGDGAEVWRERIAPLGAVNLGVSGDRTQHVLWRLQQAPLTALQPKVVVIMIGTNNSGGDTPPSEIVQGVRAIVSTVLKQCPNTRVLLLDIFPRGENFNDQRGRLAQINQVLSRTDAFGADSTRVKWHPIGAHFLEVDGTISKEVMPDQLHLSAKGYALWEGAIREEVARLAGSASE